MATRSRGGVRQALEPEMNEPLKTGTILHSTLADSETVDELFRLILGRSINNDEFKAKMTQCGNSPLMG